MKGILRVVVIFVGFIVVIIVLALLSELYEWLRHKFNTPKIGFDKFSSRIIKRGDYVCIGGRVREFDHWTRDNEMINTLHPPLDYNKTFSGNLAFTTNGLGYSILPSSSLKNCEFIYGKYGVKWAISESWAHMAKDKVEQL